MRERGDKKKGEWVDRKTVREKEGNESWEKDGTERWENGQKERWETEGTKRWEKKGRKWREWIDRNTGESGEGGRELKDGRKRARREGRMEG